ncbi:hypothetical protein KPH14_006371 [Odynerus spinipes]|uniref:Uncharacterized protein n=1 Tax=Odynerus spinipes TaxID=1348599 RepID=A0AAD9VVJ8_9HYME|nr:hypothetical protein KPH14_006371 [Odynerus spinipes]
MWLRYTELSRTRYNIVQRTAEEVDEDKTQTETKNGDLPQPPPTTPTRGRTVKSPSRVVTPQAVRSSLAKSPTTNKKNILPKSTEPVPNAEETEEKGKINASEKKTTTQEDLSKSSKSPNNPRPPNNLRLKGSNKTSPGSPRKTPPNELRLPKLAASPVHQEINTVSETESKLTLPKLIESSMQSTRVAH